MLGGALSPIDGVDPEDLRIAELYARDRRRRAVREVVLATNPTTTGEATALHIAAGTCASAPELGVTRLASGLPVGADLEYADESRSAGRFAGAVSSFREPADPPLTSARMPHPTVVMKFGGTSVADAERIQRAARRIVAKREAGQPGRRGPICPRQDDR